MELKDKKIQECPYCKEDIKKGALKCKFCLSSIPTLEFRILPLITNKPEHGGICLYCKEDIKPTAIKCKHCKSLLIAIKS